MEVKEGQVWLERDKRFYRVAVIKSVNPPKLWIRQLSNRHPAKSGRDIPHTINVFIKRWTLIANSLEEYQAMG